MTKPATFSRTIFFITSLIVILTLSLTGARQASAADIGLSINPPLLKVVVRPGKTITNVYKVENLSSTNKILIARLIPFTTADDQGNPNIDPRATAPWLGYFSLANSFIKLNEPFEIKSGQSEQLILSINIPITAPLRDLYATLLVTSYGNSVASSLQGTTLSASIGSNLLISISSSATPSTILKITDFIPEEGKYLKIGDYYILDNITPIFFTAKARNEGDFTAETKGIFKIERNEKEPINMQSVLPQYVLSKSQRKLANMEDDKFYFTPRVGLLGKYSAKIDVRSESSNASTQIDIIFFPGKILLGLAAVLIFLNIIIKFSFSSKTDTSPY